MTSRFFKKRTKQSDAKLLEDEDSCSSHESVSSSDPDSPTDVGVTAARNSETHSAVASPSHPQQDSVSDPIPAAKPHSQQDPVLVSNTDSSTDQSANRSSGPTALYSRPFPKTLADLHLTHDHTTTITPSLYRTLRNLKRSTLSITNRLSSIISDSHFVTSVSTHYQLPLVANERCGCWYCPPSHRYPHPNPRDGSSVPGGGSVYFKSTDGHHSQWSFSLRRLNLQLLRVLGERGGAVVVDSTRRGKKMSDALAKTLPIWVAVVNRVLFREEKWRKCWRLQVPDVVGESERAQVEGMVEGWCEGFRGLGLDLARLRECGRPIRVTWAVNGEWEAEERRVGDEGQRIGDEKMNLLVLCSASRRVVGTEVSEGGYIQGAGDDNESWSRRLTAAMFWRHRDLLLETAEEELPALIHRLLKESPKEDNQSDGVLIKPTKHIFLGAGTRTSKQDFDLVINCNGDSDSSLPEVLDLKCRDGKLGSRDLRENLVAANDAAAKALQRVASCRILITCFTGRDLSLGVALVLLCQFFDESGDLKLGPVSRLIDKALVKKRLAWITAVQPSANPSRSTLQAVNSFLMQRPP